MRDEDLRKAIYEDMLNLASHEAGTGWSRLSAILSGSQTDLLLAQLLKALVDQNKILIRQNELILRALSRAPTEPGLSSGRTGAL